MSPYSRFDPKHYYMKMACQDNSVTDELMEMMINVEQQFGLSSYVQEDPPAISTNLVSTYMIFHHFTLVDLSFYVPVLF